MNITDLKRDSLSFKQNYNSLQMVLIVVMLLLLVFSFLLELHYQRINALLSFYSGIESKIGQLFYLLQSNHLSISIHSDHLVSLTHEKLLRNSTQIQEIVLELKKNSLNHEFESFSKKIVSAYQTYDLTQKQLFDYLVENDFKKYRELYLSDEFLAVKANLIDELASLKIYTGSQVKTYEMSSIQDLIFLWVIRFLMYFLIVLTFSYFRKSIVKRSNFIDKLILSFEEKNNFFLKIIDSLPLSVIVKNIKSNYQYVLFNKEAEKEFCMLSSKVINKTDFEFYDKKYAERIRHTDKQVVESGKTLHLEEEQFQAGNNFFVSNCWKVPLFDAQGKPDYLVYFIENATQQQEYRLQLKLFKTVFELSKDMILITDCRLDDPGPIILFSNQETEKLSGYSVDEVIGKTPRIFQGPETCKKSLNQLKKALSSGRTFRTELINYTKNGKPFWISLSVFPLRDKNGVITHFGSIQRDITYEKNIQVELRQAKELSEKANTAKSDFLANISHELRTPLNAMIGMTQLVLNHQRIQGEDYELLTLVYKSSLSLLHLLNDILDLSRIESGAIEFECYPFNLIDLIQEVVSSFKILANDKGIELLTQIDDFSVWYFLGDAFRIKIILNNLISNAIKFTVRGSVLIVLKISSLQAGQVVVCCQVQDSGIGIPQDRLGLIFEKFSQADVSTTRHYGGSGLGLTITRELLLRMGGEVSVTSELGVGSVFTFTLPLQVANSTDLEAQSLNEVLPQENRINRLFAKNADFLVVEDHPVNQIFVIKLLEFLGVRKIDLATNGLEAEKKALIKNYHCILMDCHMPEQNGYDTTRHIRAMKPNREHDVVIIAMTANAMQEERQKCLDCGMNEYLSKPIDQALFLKKLSQWFDFSQIEVNEAITPEVSLNQSNFFEKSLEESNVVFDPTLIHHFSKGERSLSEVFIQAFVQQTRLNLVALEQSCVSGFSSKWVDAAHQLKGGSANVGAFKLARLSAEAQLMSDATASSRFNCLYAIQVAFDEFLTAVDSYEFKG